MLWNSKMHIFHNLLWSHGKGCFLSAIEILFMFVIYLKNMQLVVVKDILPVSFASHTYL